MTTSWTVSPRFTHSSLYNIQCIYKFFYRFLKEKSEICWKNQFTVWVIKTIFSLEHFKLFNNFLCQPFFSLKFTSGFLLLRMFCINFIFYFYLSYFIFCWTFFWYFQNDANLQESAIYIWKSTFSIIYDSSTYY